MSLTIERPADGRALTALAMAAILVGLSSVPSAHADSDADANGGITLPPGFSATVFADNLGHIRHLAVAPNGVVYVNSLNATLYRTPSPDGGFLIALQDADGDGKADKIQRFGLDEKGGSTGGTGIAFYKGAVFAEVNDRIERYAIPTDGIVPKGAPDVVLSELPLNGNHPMHPIEIDRDGSLFVDLGSATNSCQISDRMIGAPGISPCTELETRGGVWRYDAKKLGQTFSPSERFATGLRNAEGLAFDSAGRFFATTHGRDQLAENWGGLYSTQQGAEAPLEELVEIVRDGEYGWPQCYFDPTAQRLVLSPEYGGDGGKKVGDCGSKRAPVATYPAHWAPLDLEIYKGSQFPESYREGAFIAFHGSWNRSPSPQAGYNVVFQPMKDGRPSGPFVVFADGFAGAIKEPGRAAHRPTGLAAGPDGVLYVSDDQNGRIWRIAYSGDPKAAVAAAAPSTKGPSAQRPVAETGGDDALPTPSGYAAEQVALGGRIFRGEVENGTCAGCHGSDAAGAPIAPDLTSGKWVWGDGSVAALRKTIANGVMKPKTHPGVMPPRGGADISDDGLDALAAFVWAVSQPKH